MARLPPILIWGGGRMGTAIGQGLARMRGHENILFSQHGAGDGQHLRAQGFGIFTSSAPRVLAEAAFVAVKRPDVPAVLAALAAQLAPGTPVVSVAAGVDRQSILAMLGGDYPVLRARPNILVRDGVGNVLLQRDLDVPADVLSRVQALLSTLGEVYLCDEGTMELRTWESSSLPLVVVGELLRLQLQRIAGAAERQQAGELVLRALEGLVSGAKREGAGDLPDYLLRLRNDVATEGGLNSAALEVLAQGGMWEVLEQAARCYRERELSQLGPDQGGRQ